jgi:hypothetical protein
MPTSVSTTTVSQREKAEAVEEAFKLMERALGLLDKAGQTMAANHLDHAISVIADDGVNMPRVRLVRPAGMKALGKV